MLRIKLIKSTIAHTPRNRATIQALGLRKIRQVVEHEDTPTIRGMIQHVHPLIHVEVVEGSPSKKSEKPAPKAKAQAVAPKAKVEKAPKAEKPPAKKSAPKKAATKKEA